MRTFYAPMVTDGRAAGPVIDAFSTVVIIGFILARLVVAIPFLPAIVAELRDRPDGDGDVDTSSEFKAS